jgi:hypothetical protein
VTGAFRGTATFGDTTLIGDLRDVFVAKYDGDGNLLWVEQAGGSDLDWAGSIAVDGSGNCLVTGAFWGTATFGDTTLTSAGDHDIFVAKIEYPMTGIHETLNLPTSMFLHQNYPNPFNPTTTIRYTLPRAEFVSLKVYDILGREVATLVNERQAAGGYSVRFDANQLSSGLYFYKITTGNFNKARKMVVMK